MYRNNKHGVEVLLLQPRAKTYGHGTFSQYISVAILMACLALCSVAAAQAQPTLSEPMRPSLSHLYWHFLMYQNHLDRVAAEHEKLGKDGGWLRTAAQKKLGFTDEQFAPIRQSAKRLDVTLSGIKAKAKVIIQEDRAQYAKGLLPSGAQSVGRAKLKGLDQEREEAINSEIAKLNEALDSASSATLKDFLEAQFAASVTVGQKSSLSPNWDQPRKSKSAQPEVNQ